MSTNIIAVPSKGCILQYSPTSSPIAYVTIAHQGTLTGLSMSVKIDDVTQQDSGAPYRDFVPTLIDPGTIAFDLFFQPGTTTHKAVLKLFTDRGADSTPGSLIPFNLIFSDAALTTWTFNGFIADFKTSLPVDGVIKVAMTVRASGKVTFPA
jgi:hypothetical protein